MNDKKQIEEMGKILCNDLGCKHCERCFHLKKAENLYNAGYRKASDVARETVEAIKAEARKKEQYVNDLFGYGGYLIATTDLEDIIRKYIFDTYEEDELKKKYESEKDEQLSDSYDHLEKTKDELLAERSRLILENEILRKSYANYEETSGCKKVRVDTANKFSERFKERLDISVDGYSTTEVINTIFDTIDQIAKEIEDEN